MSEVIAEIRRELLAAADEKTKEGSSRFFKEEVRVYGVKTAAVNKLAKQFFSRLKGLGKDEIFSLCEELYKSGHLEEAGIAADWAYRIRDRYSPEDIEVFERWIDTYIDNWAACDTLCNHAVGSLVERYPTLVARLKAWAVSPNRWMRRAAAVSLVVPVRKGEFLGDALEIAGILLLDSDDMVRKGYGWLLKETSRQHQEDVFEFVVGHKAVMPRTALRYAIEKMPQDMRKRAMEK